MAQRRNGENGSAACAAARRPYFRRDTGAQTPALKKNPQPNSVRSVDYLVKLLFLPIKSAESRTDADLTGVVDYGVTETKYIPQSWVRETDMLPSYTNNSVTRSICRSPIRAVRALPLAALILFGCQIEAQAGFLEELFGSFGGGGEHRSAEAPSVERPRPRAFQSSLDYLQPQGAASNRRRSAGRKGGDKKLAGSGPVKKSFCYDQAQQAADLGEIDALLHDTTLRAGDTIVTADGLRVYQGGGGCPHKANDFLALADSRTVKSSQRNSLLAIENALKARVGGGQVRSLLFSARDQEAMSR
jgi:hypothetical protein